MSYVRDTPLQTGFHPPEQCVRGRTDCRSLAQIIATDGEQTFVCVGELSDGCAEQNDKWCFCHRSRHERDYIGGVDLRFFVDRRDMSHMAAVLGMGLATVIPPDDECIASCDTRPEGGDAPEIAAPALPSGAVGSEADETPKGGSHAPNH